MIQLHAYCLLTKSPGTCITARIWWCRKTFSQWECSFNWKLHCHWLKVLRQCLIAVVIQGPIHVPVRLIWISPESPDPYGFSELKMMFNTIINQPIPHKLSIAHYHTLTLILFHSPPLFQLIQDTHALIYHPTQAQPPCSHCLPPSPTQYSPTCRVTHPLGQPTSNSLAHSVLVIYLPTNPLIPSHSGLTQNNLRLRNSCFDKTVSLYLISFMNTTNRYRAVTWARFQSLAWS